MIRFLNRRSFLFAESPVVTHPTLVNPRSQSLLPMSPTTELNRDGKNSVPWVLRDATLFPKVGSRPDPMEAQHRPNIHRRVGSVVRSASAGHSNRKIFTTQHPSGLKWVANTIRNGLTHFAVEDA